LTKLQKYIYAILNYIMNTPEFTREDAECGIAARIRKSKLLAKVLIPAAVAAGIGGSLHGKKDDVVETALALAITGGAASFTDSIRRNRHCDRIVMRYADVLAVPRRAAMLSIQDLSADQEKAIAASVVDDEASATLSRHFRAMEIEISSSFGTGLAAAGTTYCLLEPSLSSQGAMGCGLLALGVGSLIARNQALGGEENYFLRQLSNLEWAAMHKPAEYPD
jgi:hypothetical protein